MSDPKAPIEPIPNSRVIDFGEARVQRGMTRRYKNTCFHNNLTYEPEERRVWCKDCEEQIEGFDAFMVLVKQSQRHDDDLKLRQKELELDEKQALFSRAAKALDKIFRGKRSLPLCPSCKEPLFPEDVMNLQRCSRELAYALREKREEKPND